jgi:hypothetical protein
MSAAPTHEAVLAWLQALRLGTRSREDVARWARRWQQSPRPLRDKLLLKMIVYLAAADLPGVRGRHLYGPADFEAWEIELRWETQEHDAGAAAPRDARTGAATPWSARQRRPSARLRTAG